MAVAGEGGIRGGHPETCDLIDSCHDRAELTGLGNGQSEPFNGLPPPARKPGVLVADDEARLRALLVVALRQHGFVVWLAADGQEAVEMYRDHRPEIDLVVLDVGMPGLDGRDALRALREINPDACCCFMVTHSDFAYERDLLDLGAKRIFQKPFELVAFIYMLSQLANHKETVRAVPCPVVSEDDYL